MNDVSTPMMNLLQKFLDVTSQRHKVEVTNMANVDTPGYRTQDIDFRGELQRAVSNGPANFTPIVRWLSAELSRAC